MLTWQVGRPPEETEPEGAVKEHQSDADESEEEELDRWFLASEEKVNESEIRS